MCPIQELDSTKSPRLVNIIYLVCVYVQVIIDYYIMIKAEKNTLQDAYALSE